MAPKKQQAKDKKAQSTKKIIILDTKAKILAAKQAKYGAPSRPKGPPTQSELRAKKKAEEEAKERELRMLFKPVPDKKEAERKKKEKEDREARERGELPPLVGGEDGDDPYAHLKEGDDYLWNPEDFEPIEMIEAKLEEELQKELEALRAKLESGEIAGNKVTAETFAKWKQEKREQKAVEDRKKRKHMIKTGHMTGRMLYDMNSAVFVDDEEGMVTYEREEEEAVDENVAIKEIADEFDASLFMEQDDALLEVEDIEADENEEQRENNSNNNNATSSSSSSSSCSSKPQSSSSSSTSSAAVASADDEGSDEGRQGDAVIAPEDKAEEK